ncbi:GIP, partial [Symbiodinium sp. CCMP2456]
MVRAQPRSWQPRRGALRPGDVVPDIGEDLEQQDVAADVNEPNQGDDPGGGPPGEPPGDPLEGEGDPWRRAEDPGAAPWQPHPWRTSPVWGGEWQDRVHRGHDHDEWHGAGWSQGSWDSRTSWPASGILSSRQLRDFHTAELPKIGSFGEHGWQGGGETTSRRMSWATAGQWDNGWPADAQAPWSWGKDRPTEKVSVPEFEGTGADDSEIGKSARSYIRKVQVWLRCTRLPPEQRALALYNALSGRAWIYAEELDMDTLASAHGVPYYLEWVQTRFAEVELHKISQVMGDLFKSCKRRPEQPIRDFIVEYERLLLRLQEVQCELPSMVKAWLFVDKLRLSESEELALLSSVNNQWCVKRLQQAALLQERSFRKAGHPGNEGKNGWRGNGRWHKNTVHMTAAAEEDDESEGSGGAAHESDSDLVPEDVAADHHTAYVAYQAAKDRYKAATQGRGTDQAEVKRRAEERLRLAKSRSFCSVCKRRGHWHKDDACPLKGKRPENNHNSPEKTAHECHAVHLVHMTEQAAEPDGAIPPGPDVLTPWLATTLNTRREETYLEEPIRENPEGTIDKGNCARGAQTPCRVYMAGPGGKHTAAAPMLAIIDTACTKTVAGHDWFEAYCELASEHGFAPEIVEEVDHFKFGASRTHRSNFSVRAWFALSGRLFQTSVAVVPCKVPLLLSRPALSALGLIYDVAGQTVAFTKLFLSNLPLEYSATGHPAIPVGQFCGARPPTDKSRAEQLVWVPEQEAYMAHGGITGEAASGDQGFKALFFPKKVPTVVREMLEGAWDSGGQGFMAWWRTADQSRDFWVETPTEMIRVHMVPRKSVKSCLVDFGSAAADSPKWPSPRPTPLRPARRHMASTTSVWKLKKAEIIEELRSYGVPCHERWLLPELRNILQEQRAARAPPAETDPMKGISKLSLSELITRCQENQITLPSKPTRGALIALLRSSTQAPGERLLPFGKFRGWMYKETPEGYRQWAQAEVEANANHSPDLAAFASWAAAKDEKTKEKATSDANKTIKDLTEDPEVNPKVPVPTAKALGLAAGATSSDEPSGPWVKVPVRGAAPKRSWLRRPREDEETSDLEAEIPEEAQQEIEKIEVSDDEADVGHADSEDGRRDTGRPCYHHESTTSDYEAAPVAARNPIYITEGDLGEATDEDEEPEAYDQNEQATIREKIAAGARRRRRAKEGLGKRAQRSLKGILQAMVCYCTVAAAHTAEVLEGPARDLWSVFQSEHYDPGAGETGADFLEIFAGKAHISQAVARAKGAVLEPLDPRYGHDLYHHDFQEAVLETVAAERPRMIWVHPPDRRRARAREQGLVHFLERLASVQSRNRGFFAVQNPRGSELWRHPVLENWIDEQRAEFAEVDLFGGGPRDQAATAPRRKGMSVLTSCPDLSAAINARDFGNKRLTGPPGVDLWGEAAHPYDFARLVARTVLKANRRGSYEVMAADAGGPSPSSSAAPAGEGEAHEEPVGADSISFKGKVNPAVAQILKRLHQNLGHPPNRELIRHLRIGGAGPALVQAAEQLVCRTCNRSTKAKLPRVAKPVVALDFGEVLSIDVIWLEAADSEGADIPALNMVDVASTYQVVYPLAGTKSEDAVKAFMNGWVSWAGAPRFLIGDLDSAFKDQFLNYLDQQAIHIRCAAGQAHWQNSVAERQGESWKAVWKKHVEANLILKEEAPEAIAAINAAKNSLRNRSGYSPRQWLFGANQRLPGDPFDAPEEDGIHDL